MARSQSIAAMMASTADCVLRSTQPQTWDHLAEIQAPNSEILFDTQLAPARTAATIQSQAATVAATIWSQYTTISTMIAIKAMIAAMIHVPGNAQSAVFQAHCAITAIPMAAAISSSATARIFTSVGFSLMNFDSG